MVFKLIEQAVVADKTPAVELFTHVQAQLKSKRRLNMSMKQIVESVKTGSFKHSKYVKGGTYDQNAKFWDGIATKDQYDDLVEASLCGMEDEQDAGARYGLTDKDYRELQDALMNEWFTMGRTGKATEQQCIRRVVSRNQTINQIAQHLPLEDREMYFEWIKQQLGKFFNVHVQPQNQQRRAGDENEESWEHRDQKDSGDDPHWDWSPDDDETQKFQQDKQAFLDKASHGYGIQAPSYADMKQSFKQHLDQNPRPDIQSEDEEDDQRAITDEDYDRWMEAIAPGGIAVPQSEFISAAHDLLDGDHKMDMVIATMSPAAARATIGKITKILWHQYEADQAKKKGHAEIHKSIEDEETNWLKQANPETHYKRWLREIMISCKQFGMNPDIKRTFADCAFDVLDNDPAIDVVGSDEKTKRSIVNALWKMHHADKAIKNAKVAAAKNRVKIRNRGGAVENEESGFAQDFRTAQGVENEESGHTYNEAAVRNLYQKAIGAPPRDSWWKKWSRSTPEQKQQIWNHLSSKTKSVEDEETHQDRVVRARRLGQMNSWHATQDGKPTPPNPHIPGTPRHTAWEKGAARGRPQEDEETKPQVGMDPQSIHKRIERLGYLNAWHDHMDKKPHRENPYPVGSARHRAYEKGRTRLKNFAGAHEEEEQSRAEFHTRLSKAAQTGIEHAKQAVKNWMKTGNRDWRELPKHAPTSPFEDSHETEAFRQASDRTLKHFIDNYKKL